MAKVQYYIIVTVHTNFVQLAMEGNAEYAELLQLQKEGKLVSGDARVVPRAIFKQTPNMLVEDYFDEVTGITVKRFRDDVVAARGDGLGRIWVEKGREDVARKVLQTLRVIDPSAHLDPEGLILPEEMTEEQKRRAAGGRPRGSR